MVVAGEEGWNGFNLMLWACVHVLQAQFRALLNFHAFLHAAMPHRFFP